MKNLYLILTRLLVLIMVLTLTPFNSSVIIADAAVYSQQGQEYYEISTAEDLYNIRTTDAALYVLINDIDLSGQYYNWEPIKEFSGILDGNGYCIYGLNIESDWKTAGLFIKNTGEIKNLVLEDFKIVSNNKNSTAIGFLVAENGGIISNVRIEGGNHTELNSISGYSGGLVGINSGLIIDCHVNANVKGEVAGALVGYSKPGGSIIKSSSYGVVSGRIAAGGLVGRNQGNISNSFSQASLDIPRADSYIEAGGISGQNTGTIYYCYSVVGINKNISNYISGIARGDKVAEVVESFYEKNILTVTHKDTKGEALTAHDMKKKAVYLAAGWDFNSIWGIDEGESYPFLLKDTEIEEDTDIDNPEEDSEEEDTDIDDPGEDSEEEDADIGDLEEDLEEGDSDIDTPEENLDKEETDIEYLNDEDKLILDLQELIKFMNRQNLSGIDKDLNLPTRGIRYNSEISWESSREDVISRSGKVTRPKEGEKDISVKLIATLTTGSSIEIKEFSGEVKAYPYNNVVNEDWQPISNKNRTIQQQTLVENKVVIKNKTTDAESNQKILIRMNNIIINIDNPIILKVLGKYPTLRFVLQIPLPIKKEEMTIYSEDIYFPTAFKIVDLNFIMDT